MNYDNLISPVDLASKYFGKFKIKDNEILPRYCPFCGGGTHKDINTFALNIDKGTYNCLRGKCGARGTYKHLLHYLGEKKMHTNKRRRKNYKKPDTKMEKISKKVADYLKLRGLSQPTWEKLGICEKNGHIVFPYYENDELVMTKSRPPGKGNNEWRRNKGGKPVLWNMQNVEDTKRLIITEGEWDAAAITEAGFSNVVSVPSGSKDMNWIRLCWEWLQPFEKIVIWGDTDDCGKQMIHDIVVRLGEWRCCVIESDHKDANESLYLEGKDYIREKINNVKPVEITGSINLAEIEPIDITEMTTISSGLKEFDNQIIGFLLGQISLWTGDNASGKSTILGQLLLEALNEDFSVAAYSGELRAEWFKYWIDVQAAGLDNIMEYERNDGYTTHYVEDEVKQKIEDWYNERFFLYDSLRSSTTQDILEVFSKIARRYGTKVFLIDNIMTTFFTGKEDIYRQQSQFIGLCKEFANKYNAHVHIVAHPRKSQGSLLKQDVAGSYEIVNRTDNLFSMKRIDDGDRADDHELVDVDAQLSILKNRFLGIQNKKINLRYNEISRRFTEQNNDEDRHYGWEKPTDWF